LGGFVSRVFGTIPEDIVGVVVGDYLHHVRIRNLSKLEERTERILRERNVEAEPVSPSLALPLFAAARDETREELQELWAHLLAAAMDPSRRSLVRRDLIDIVKQMEPLDVRVVQALAKRAADQHSNMQEGSPPSYMGEGLDKELGVTPDEIVAASDNLTRLGLQSPGAILMPHGVTSIARLILRAAGD
jgi:Abortive infection alpha